MEESNRQSKFAPAPLLLTAYPAMAKHDEALALLQKGLAERSHLLATLKVDPLYDPLRGDQGSRIDAPNRAGALTTFSDLTGDPGEEYFSDGLTEERAK